MIPRKMRSGFARIFSIAQSSIYRNQIHKKFMVRPKLQTIYYSILIASVLSGVVAISAVSIEKVNKLPNREEVAVIAEREISRHPDIAVIKEKLKKICEDVKFIREKISN